ncbi:MAG: hypothetical protein R3F39_24700 [Myxococcota bacterium]
MHPRLLLSFLLLSLTPACGSASSADADADAAELPDVAADTDADTAADSDAAAQPEIALWSTGPAFPVDPPVPAGFADLTARLSTWVTHVEGPVPLRPETGLRGGYGTGNGRVFALFGLTDPLNTMHGMTGPTYERGKRFFSDYAIRLAGAGVSEDSDAEWATQSLAGPALLTRARYGALWLDVLAFAPALGAASDHCLLRVIEVRNTSGEASGPLSVRVEAAGATTSPSAETMLESTGERALTTGFSGGQGTVTGRTLTAEIPSITAGGVERLTLLHCAAEGGDAVPIPQVDPESLAQGVAAEFAAWSGGLAQFDVPDPRVRDFLDGMKLSLRVQTSREGANCPMSQYTRIWARDTIGAVLAWLRYGAHDEVRRMMTYLYLAASAGGDLRNSYDADMSFDPPPAALDWDALGPLSAKVAAETPSYMVWTAGEWLRFTGDATPIADRWPFYRRCLLRQVPSADGLLPFTGDETFRTAMNVAFGYPLEYPHHDVSWSANSSLLWLGAHQHFQAMARATGHDADLDAAAALETQIRKGFLDHYVLDDDCIAALVVRETGETYPAPFEDVSLKLTWAGAFDPDSAFARDAMNCLIAKVGTTPGRFQSPMHDNHLDFPLVPDATGVYTGMMPGYALAALTDVGHPDAESSFTALSEVLGSSGNLQEYQLAPDDSGLSLLYDPSGALGDYTAKFRPWEGGIVAAAAMDYLVGFDPDAGARTLTLRPHLPSHWPELAVTGLRAGAARFDVRVSRTAAGWTVTASHDAAEAWDIRVRWDSAAAVAMASGEGQAVAVTRTEAFGQHSATSPAISVPAGGTLTLHIEAAE